MAKSGTPAQVKKKFATWGNYNWYGMCAAVVHTVCRHFGYVTKADTPYPSAMAAYRAAKAAGNIKSRDPKKAPRGGIHYWAYRGRNSRGEIGDWGHTGVDMTGGGRAILNATSMPNERYGVNVGTSTFAEIDGRVGEYLGWGTTYGSEYAANITDPNPPKPTKPTPAPAGSTHQEDDEMIVRYTKPKGSKKVYALYADGTVRHVGRVEWLIVKATEKVTGRKTPYTTGIVTEAEIATLPKHVR